MTAKNLTFSLVLFLCACGESEMDPPPDASAGDASLSDAGPGNDGGVSDAGTADGGVVDCTVLESQEQWALCASSADGCEGVFEDGSGCDAFCAAVGLECTASYDNRDGMCAPNMDLPALGCAETGHDSDYCVCGGACVPSCDGRRCGDDGCGGQCGSCGDGEECIAGSCEVQSGELKAFPSAFGAGAYVTGGRGGRVVHVSNLNDGGPGSFREALALDEPRIVVFDVAGVIRLESIISDVGDNLTVAGQTAPAGGITIDGGRLYLDSVDNVIFRYVRFRGGVDTDNDSLTVVGDITNQIFDHCSFSFDNDETASWYTQGEGEQVDALTIQRCFFGEGSKGSIVGGSSGVDVGEVSVLRNLYYNQTHRYPNIANFGGSIEVINNVSWTAGNRLVRGDGNGRLNHLGNYNDYGVRGITNTRMNMHTYDSEIVPSIYTAGNLIVAENTGSPLEASIAELNADNRRSWRVFQDSEGLSRGDALPGSYFADRRHPLLGVETTVLSAEDAFREVSSDVGANARLTADGSVVSNSDVLDTAWLQNVRDGVYVPRVSRSEYDVPPIEGGEAYLDTDRDGMPDVWELARGLNPEGDDSAGDDDRDGYTNIEEFLNGVDR